MYNVFKSVIDAGEFKFAEIRHKIMKLYAIGEMTETEMDTLLAMASNHVSSDAERPETLAMLKSLSDRMDAIEARLNSMGDVPPEESTEYPAWEPWNGMSNQYQPGAIVSHNSKLWQSTYDGQNVWEPGAVGIDERFWVEYTTV